MITMMPMLFVKNCIHISNAIIMLKNAHDAGKELRDSKCQTIGIRGFSAHKDAGAKLCV